MPTPRVSFVGFGEVASVFSKAVSEAGAEVRAFDVNLTRPGGPARLEGRRKAAAVRLAPLAEAVRDADLVLSTVRPQTARDAARECAAHLRAGQTYVDFNSTSPAVKIEIAGIIAASGATFVEGAILGAVGATGAATPAIAGNAAVAETLTRLGLRVSFLDGPLGRVTLFKLLRSIFSKGAEALLLELTAAAREAGLEEALWKDVVVELMTRTPFEKTAKNWIDTHPAARARRHHEMQQVVGALRELGIDPVMSAATEEFFRRSCEGGP